MKARLGMRVVAADDFPVGHEAGRVCRGIGVITSVDSEIGTLSVWWELYSEKTVWTRASHGQHDVVDITNRGVV